MADPLERRGPALQRPDPITAGRWVSAVVNPGSPCFRIAMICSSLCGVPFIAVLLSSVWDNSQHLKPFGFGALTKGI
jgi:hypothetical protein